MTKRAWTALAIAALAVLAPPAALAKGASEATITGPGLDRPITMAGEGQAGGEALMEIAGQAGFFPAVFAQTPDPMLDRRPTGELGPRYRITYVMPGPNNESDELLQDVYPYAKPAPVSYTKPGQRFWTTERTRGGWFVASSSLRDKLVAAGLPSTPPAGGDTGDVPWAVVGAVAALTGVLGAAALGFYAIGRRRPDPATASRV